MIWGSRGDEAQAAAKVMTLWRNIVVVVLCPTGDEEVKWSEMHYMHRHPDSRVFTSVGGMMVPFQFGDTVLNTTVKEKDLRLTISADMKVSEQCGIAAAKGNQIIGLIRRNIVYKEKLNNTAV